MLSAPYQKILTIENNNYYLLSVENTYYLATETILRLENGDEIQQGLKVMPLYSATMLSLIAAIKLEKIGEDTLEDYDAKEDGDLGKTEYFAILDVDSIREQLNEEIKGLGKEFKSRFSYTKNIGSELLSSLLHDSRFQFLMAEQLDSRVRFVWAVKSNKFGDVTFHQVLVAGKNTRSEKIITINTYVLTRELIGTVLMHIQKSQEEAPTADEPVEKVEVQA